MPVCPKCHRWKKASYFRRHARTCRPSRDDIMHFSVSKTSLASAERRRRKKAEKAREVA